MILQISSGLIEKSNYYHSFIGFSIRKMLKLFVHAPKRMQKERWGRLEEGRGGKQRGADGSKLKDQ